MMKYHLDQTTAEGVARRTSDGAADVDAYGKVHAQALEMAPPGGRAPPGRLAPRATARQAGFTRQRPGPAHRPPVRNENPLGPDRRRRGLVGLEPVRQRG